MKQSSVAACECLTLVLSGLPRETLVDTGYRVTPVSKNLKGIELVSAVGDFSNNSDRRLIVIARCRNPLPICGIERSLPSVLKLSSDGVSIF